MEYGLHFIVYLPVKAPTAPKPCDDPSMILASHSTFPLSVKLEPTPAFVQGEFWGK